MDCPRQHGDAPPLKARGVCRLLAVGRGLTGREGGADGAGGVVRPNRALDAAIRLGVRATEGTAVQDECVRQGFPVRAVSPFLEMGAYEALWSAPEATFRSLAERFAARPGSVPSDFVGRAEAETNATEVKRRFARARVVRFGVRVQGGGEYPPQLRDAAHPVALLYYQGWWDLASSPSVAVVGTRRPSAEGIARTRRLVQALVADDYTVVSGLAAGIDRAAHEAALDAGGRTVGVIGTPLSHAYPPENRRLQQRLAADFLVISQVPVRRYEDQDYRRNRAFFPARNVTMSALTAATVVVEAGATSGTLLQAGAALRQGRTLFIMDNCFRDTSLAWPERLEANGAVRVRTYNDIRARLSATRDADR